VFAFTKDVRAFI